MLYKNEQVIDFFKEKELLEMDRGRVWDFLPNIQSCDESILKTWTDHFRSVGAPYIVTQRSNKKKVMYAEWKTCDHKKNYYKNEGIL